MSNSLFKALGAVQDAATKVLYGTEQKIAKSAFSELVDRNMNGEELPKLYDEFHTRGFKILAFPCNQFGGQEPGTHDEIIEFVKTFDTDMPSKLTFFEKADVNGANAREVFSFLKQELPNEDGTLDVRWNFAKFLVDHQGVPYKRYFPKTSPFDLKGDIEELLRKKETS